MRGSPEGAGGGEACPIRCPPPAGTGSERIPQIRLDRVAVGYGGTPVQRDLSFSVERGRVFVIMGDSGCGKSTLMRSLAGLLPPQSGRIFFDGWSFWEAPEAERLERMRRHGVMYQGGALWSSMTLLENVALPLEHYSRLSPRQIAELAVYKLALVGLASYCDYYPSEISGGMRKRVGVARAMALDPDLLFFDEPSAGLDPLSARLLDELILELRDALGTTMVVITHDLDSIFAIADDSVFLDAASGTRLASGPPRQLREDCPNARVRDFLNRGGTATRRTQ